MQTSLLGIAQKAKQNKKYKFGNLYELIDKYALLQAWRQINKGAASGVDRETAKDTIAKVYARNFEEALFRHILEYVSESNIFNSLSISCAVRSSKFFNSAQRIPKTLVLLPSSLPALF